MLTYLITQQQRRGVGIRAGVEFYAANIFSNGRGLHSLVSLMLS